MKKGVKVFGLIAVLIAIGSLFVGIVSTEVIVADVNKDIAATNVNVTPSSPKDDLELVRGDYETDTSTKNKTERIKVTPIPISKPTLKPRPTPRPKPTSTHDMVVTNVNTTPSSPDLEQPTVIYVTVTNEGEQQEDNVSVKVYVDSAQIGTTQYISLAPGLSNTTTFLWSPTTAKTYSVKGEVGIVNGEIDIKDNTKRVRVRVSAVPTPMPGTPSNPSPSNHTIDVYINTNLDWSDCSNTDFYDVYFGTYTHPPYYGNAPTSNYPFQNDLDYNTKYYWKIVAKSNGGGITQGPIWDFNTEEAPNQQPTAIIDSITPDYAEQGTDTVSFTGNGTDPDGTVEAYDWSSSIDGPLSTSAAFTKPASELSVGTHAIYFKVQDDDGAWSTEDTEDLTINPANQQPTAIIDSLTPDPAEQGTDTVSFSGNGTDPDGTVVAYNWSSSIDGQLSTSAAFTKQASELSVGTHTIYFKVQDNDGTWSTEDKADLTINPANQQPTAIIDSITLDPAEQGTDTVSFTGNGTDTDGTVEAYNWSSSIDGPLSTSAAFTKPASELSVGTHTIYFKVQDNDGTWSTEDKADLTINPANVPPTAIIDSITTDPAEQGTNTVSFSGNGTDPDGTVEAYNWSSSIDGQLSTSAAFTKQASELSVGTHAIYFKVQDDDGTWSTEDTADLTIYPGPELSYSPESHEFCDMCKGETDNTTFELWNSGTDALTYSLSETCDWLEVHPTIGSSTGEHNSITVDMDTTGLFEGSHTCDIKINSNDGSGTFTVMVTVMPCPCGNMSVNLTSWSTTLKCSESDNGIVTVSASDCIVNGVTVSKVSGPTWLSVSQTDLGDIASGSSETFTVTAAPPAGTSSGDYPYSIRVSNTCGTPSTRDVAGTINVNENADGQTDYWAVIVGVADYTGTSYDLAYTDDDAIDLYNTLLLSDHWQADHIKLLLDSEADRAGILAAFDWLDDNEDPDDVVLFFFSGHGTYDVDDDGDEFDGWDEFFCPYDFNNIRDDELDAELDRLGSTSIVVIMDTCFAGGMTKDSSVKTLPKQKVELTDGFAKDIQSTGKDMGDAGRVVLMACDDDEYSYEIYELENGLFSYYVIVGLERSADAEGNGDNICSAEETFVYAEPRVVDIISTQNPQLYDGYIGELPITRPPCPELSYSPTSHDFGDKCEGVTDSTTFELWNSGTGTLTYSLSESCGWIDVQPTSGSSTGEHDTITVDIDTTSLFEGYHTCDISLSSNGGSGTFTVMVNVVQYPESSWTFMIYLDGDNNLESAAIDDFMEMSSVGSTSDVNIVVQFDRIPGYASSYGDWTDCKRFHVTSGMTPTPANATEDLGECNMGDPDTLRAFVEWAMTEFPADNYALILWNHGDGWKSINDWVPWADDIKDAKDAGLSRGICWDNTNIDYLSLQETEQALTGKYVQLLGYDACLMHMIEVVYQVMDNAGVSVGSEEVEPGDGWPYDTILADLNETPTMTPRTLGTVIVQRYMEFYGYAGSETQSAMDNSALPNLVAAVDNLAQALINEINAGHVADVQQARNAAEEIYYNYYIDLYNFAQKIQTYVPGAAAQAQAVMNEVSSSMYEAHGSSVPNDHGLSIYFPRVEGDYFASYDNTAFASDTQWNEFLKEYYAPTICGNMNVNPTSWSTTVNCSESDNEIVTVSATGGTVKGVTGSKVSGPTWLSVSPTDLGDIASGSSKTFTMTASPPSETSGDFGYTIRVSNTCGTPSTRDVSGTINVSCPCGNMGVNSTSWSPTLNCSESDNEIVSVSATGGTVKGVTGSKVSGPTWLSVSPTDLGDIASGSSKTFTMTASPPSETSGDFGYTIRVSNTCGTPSTRDVSGTINVSCPCGNMGVNSTSWSPTLNCSESDNEIVSVSATGGTVKGVTGSKVSGPTWLSVSPTDLGDIASGSSKTFTMTTSPPPGISGDFPYTIRVSNTCGTPSTLDVSGTINVSCPCGNMGVNPTSWSSTLNCSESDNEIVTVSASDNIVNGVTVSKVSGPTWLSVSPTDLGDIASGSSKTFTMTTSPPPGISGDFPYTVRVSNTCGTPSTRDVAGTINVSCPCGNMGVNSTSWSPTLNCSESDNEIVTVSASDCIVNGVTVSKVSGPTWLSVSPTDLGDIASGSSKTFTMTTSPPSKTSGDYPYTITVSNTCGSPSSIDVTGTIHVDCPESSWTYMVYLDGDNNLEGAGIDDFMEMSSVGSSPTVNIVVQFDRIPGYVSSYGDWTDCKRFHVTSGMTPMPANATSDLGECNMGDPNTLRDFVTWAMTNFSADNYALILWNHGDGWKSINKWVPWADDIKDVKDAGLSRGICWDITNNDYLSLQETEQALTGKYVQLLGYDACLMHMIEVVYQVRTNAGVSVGSEESEPGDGWPYDTILADLTGTPTMNEDTLGRVIVDRYMASYPTYNDLTQSAMANSALPNLVAAVDNLAQALMTEINAGHVADIQQARNAAEEIYYNYYIDLYHFAEMVDTYVPGAAAQAQVVMNEVSKMYEAHGSSVPNDHGLSIYFPRVEGDYLASYDNTAFASDTEWNEFLKKYYNPPTQGGDICVFRDGWWYVSKQDHSGTDWTKTFRYGIPGDKPVIGDIDNDGIVDAVIFRNGWWYVSKVDHSGTDWTKSFRYGIPGDKPVIGDIDNDGIVDAVIFRNGWWYVSKEDHSGTDWTKSFRYGIPGDKPVIGDIDNDGIVDAVIFRNGWWYVSKEDHSGTDWTKSFRYGIPGDKPVIGDIDNNGVVDTVIFRNGWWYVSKEDHSGTDWTKSFRYGIPGDIPVVGDI